MKSKSGERAKTEITENTKNGSRFSLIFSSFYKSVCRFGYSILTLRPAQLSQFLFKEINLALNGFNFYNDMP